MRIISIETPPELLDRIQAIIKKIKSQLDHRNVKVNYNISDKFKAQLFGYDGLLKHTTNIPDNIPKFIDKIDTMPMGKREKLLEMCGLPNIPQTSHCFNDSTHHTCCSLGVKAREYADKSGNPIGIASENAFYERYNTKPGKNNTNWCTCTGSKVCSYYKNRFNDGTDIKFIGNLNTKNEDIGKKKLNIHTHRTPGID